MNRNVQVSWKKIRMGVVAADTALTAATYDSLPTNRVYIGGDVTTLKLMAFGTGDENGMVLVDLFGGHGQKGNERQPAIFLGTFGLILGTMQCNNDPVDAALAVLTSNFYFDGNPFLAQGGVADVKLGLDGQNNARISIIIVRLTGESWIYAQIRTLTNITKFNLIGTWVNETLPETLTPPE